MAFTGTPVVTQLSDSICRVTGVSLAGAATGTIGIHGSGAQVELPAAFQPKTTVYNGAPVPLTASIDATAKVAASGVTTEVPIEVTKSGSGGFTTTFTNTTTATASGTLEIYFKYLS